MNSLQQTHEVRLRGLAGCSVRRTVWLAPRLAMVVELALENHDCSACAYMAWPDAWRTVWRARGPQWRLKPRLENHEVRLRGLVRWAGEFIAHRQWVADPSVAAGSEVPAGLAWPLPSE
jgi:hypothetical protein